MVWVWEPVEISQQSRYFSCSPYAHCRTYAHCSPWRTLCRWICPEGTVACEEPTLEQAYPEGLQPIGRTHAEAGKSVRSSTAEPLGSIPSLSLLVSGEVEKS